MYGMLSGKGSSNGVMYYRLIMLIGLLSTSIIGVVAPYLLTNAREIFFDRAFIVMVFTAMIIWSYHPKMNRKHFQVVAYMSFYLITLQCLLACWNNEFSPFYYFYFFMVVQCCMLSFTTANAGTLYVVFTLGVALLFIQLSHAMTYELKLMNSGIVFLASLLNVYFGRLKCSFVQTIKTNRDVLRSLINKTEHGVFVTDTNGLVYDCNSRAEEMFGYSRSELINLDFKILRKKELTDDEIEFGLDAIFNSNFWCQDTILVKKDGSEINAYVSIALVERRDKKFLVYRVRDTTQNKQFEKELIAARDIAEEAALAKSQFLATMTHEIRTPLNGVIGMASLMSNTDLDMAQREYVDTILKSGQSLMVLINDILDYSKFESGKMKIDITEGSVPDCITEVVDLLRPHAESKGLRMEVDIDHQLPSLVKTDVNRLRQVLLNLIGNAIKFTPSGYVKVACRAVAKTNEYVQFKIDIIDSGIGIPDEKMHLLFQSFSQVDASHTRRFGGTGLGLAISKQIINLLDGDINVTSSQGLGSVFSILLKSEIVEVSSKQNASDMEEINLDFSMLSELKVLIAEDNGVNQKVLQYMLDQLGVKSDLANNGREAVQLTKSNDYDIVFMDVQMPEMDGIEATELIRKAESRQPYIVAMTANVSNDDRESCSRCGMNEFISKPFLLNQIKRVFHYYLNSDQMRQEKAA